MKKLFLCATCIGLASFALPALANIQISEIMYDVTGTDAGYEWIELHNTGSTGVDISDWRFNENETDHYLSLEFGDSPVISPGGYALVVSNSAKYLESNTTFSGILFDSVFSLNNQGESLSIKSTEEIVDTVYYTPQDAANGTGGSLQYINGAWEASLATPGQVNSLQAVSTEQANEASGSTTNTSDPSGPKKKSNVRVEFEPYYQSTLHTEPVILAGDLTVFDFELLHYHRENKDAITKHSGTYVWNMGDGYEFSQDWEEEMEYVYAYPGKYVVSVSYYRNNQMTVEPKHEFAQTITVEDSEVVIGEVDEDGSIRIDNNTGKRIDISEWIMIYSDQIYAFPDRSIIPIGEKRYIANNVHRLKGLDESSNHTLFLILPSGIIQNSVIPNDLMQEQEIIEPAPLDPETEEDKNKETEIILSSTQNKTSQDMMFWLVVVLGIFFTSITLYVMWYLRQQENPKKESDLSKNQTELVPEKRYPGK